MCNCRREAPAYVGAERRGSGFRCHVRDTKHLDDLQLWTRHETRSRKAGAAGLGHQLVRCKQTTAGEVTAIALACDMRADLHHWPATSWWNDRWAEGEERAGCSSPFGMYRLPVRSIHGRTEGAPVLPGPSWSLPLQYPPRIGSRAGQGSINYRVFVQHASHPWHQARAFLVHNISCATPSTPTLTLLPPHRQPSLRPQRCHINRNDQFVRALCHPTQNSHHCARQDRYDGETAFMSLALARHVELLQTTTSIASPAPPFDFHSVSARAAAAGVSLGARRQTPSPH